MKKTLSLLTVVVGLFAIGCIKIETTKSGIPTGINALTETEKKLIGKWKPTYSKSFEYDNGLMVAERDALLSIDSCKRDNLLDFRDDHLLYGDVNTANCLPNEAQTYLAGMWAFTTGSPEKLTIIDTSINKGVVDILPLTILELTSNRIKLYRDSTSLVDGHTLSSKTFVVLER